MVNDNEAHDANPNAETPKKRSRLFGRKSDAAAPAVTPPEATAPQATAPQTTAEDSASTAPAIPEPLTDEGPRAPRRRTAAKSAADHVSAAAASATDESALPADGSPVPEKKTRSRSPRGGTAKGGTEQGGTEQGGQQSDSSTDTPEVAAPLVARSTTSLLFQAPDLPPLPPVTNRGPQQPVDGDESGTVRRRSRRRSGEDARAGEDAPNTVVRVRQPRPQPEPITEPQRVKGSTRLEAKKQRRRDGRDAGRRRPVVTESEFLARRESVDRVMVVRSKFGRIQIAVLEDGVLVEHYVAKAQDASLIGNVYLGRVQNVLPSMEAAFVDIGRGRNAVLYSGEVDWDAAAAEGEGKNQARRIELALKPGDRVLVQVTKDPVGHKGARLTSQVSLPGRYLVYVPNGSMSGISRKLPDTERARLKKILKEVLPENVGVIVRTAAEGATEEQLTLDVNRLTNQWAEISRLVETQNAPALLHSEPDLLIKIIRDVFNEDFQKLVIEGDDARQTIEGYLRSVAPDLLDRLGSYEGSGDSFDEYRVSEQIEKALDRKVWLPSGGSLVIDRTEAMTVVDVNTGKFVGSGGNLEETVTKNNLEAAEEIVRQLRLRDIGGIIVVDFIDMVLESNRDLVLRRLVECLSRDRTKHQVAEVTSLGLVQMTRKKLGLGLLETFSESCEVCAGRGIIVHHDPVTKHRQQTQSPQPEQGGGRRRNRGGGGGNGNTNGNGNTGGGAPSGVKNGVGSAGTHAITEDVRNALARVASVTVHHDAPTEGTDAPAAVTGIIPAFAPEPVREQPAGQTSEQNSEQTSDSHPVTSELPVAILDIPVTKQPRQKRAISTHDAEQFLETVLEALPEPKQPGQGRTRVSRRAGSAGQVVSAPAEPISE